MEDFEAAGTVLKIGLNRKSNQNQSVVILFAP